MPEFYTWVILLENQSKEIDEKPLSDFGSRGGQISPLMQIPLSSGSALFAKINITYRDRITS